MKKVLALLLSLLMIVSLGAVAYAVHDDDDEHGDSTAAVVGEEGLFTKDTEKQYYAVKGTDGQTHTVVMEDGQIVEVDGVAKVAEGAEGYAAWKAKLDLVTAGAKLMGILDSYTAETEFWLKVDKDASSEGTETHGEAAVVKEGFTYLVDYTTKTDTNIQVTVPLYVCMYGFGGDGKVVVPTAENYKMLNSSTYERDTKVDAITEYVVWNPDLFSIVNVTIKVEKDGAADGEIDPKTGLEFNKDYKIEKDDDYNDLVSGKTVPQVDEIDKIIVTALEANDKIGDGNGAAFLQKDITNGYGFYVKDAKLHAEPEGKYEIVSAFKDGKLYFKTAYTNEAGTVDDWLLSGTYVGKVWEPDDAAFNLDKTGLAVDVVRLQAQRPGEWNIVSANTDQKDILARQFTLTINSVDMYNVLHAEGSMLDISNLAGWRVPAPEGTTAGKLPLPITSSIAGDSVNEDTHTNVLNVAYTIVPEPFHD